MCGDAGTSANDVHFQAFLLEGIYRWNENRMSAAGLEGSGFERCYDSRLKQCSQLATALYGQSFVAPSRPMQYTGELFGIDYLFHQTGQSFHLPSAETFDDDDDIELEESQELDDGFHDVEDLTVPVDYIDESRVLTPALTTAEEPATSASAPESIVSAVPDTASSEDESVEPPTGREAVDCLAAYLVTLDTESFLTNWQTQTIVRLWSQLADYDKRRVTYKLRFQRRLDDSAGSIPSVLFMASRACVVRLLVMALKLSDQASAVLLMPSVHS